jgi:hypothetical protein
MRLFLSYVVLPLFLDRRTSAAPAARISARAVPLIRIGATETRAATALAD